MYVISQVYSGCEIIILNEKQEETLMKITESMLLRKLGLSEKFPRKILCAQKSQLGVGIMKPSTIITTLALKLYLGHKRQGDTIARKITINEKNASFQHGHSKDVMNVKRRAKPTKGTWSDEVAKMLMERKIKTKRWKK